MLQRCTRIELTIKHRHGLGDMDPLEWEFFIHEERMMLLIMKQATVLPMLLNTLTPGIH